MIDGKYLQIIDSNTNIKHLIKAAISHSHDRKQPQPRPLWQQQPLTKIVNELDQRFNFSSSRLQKQFENSTLRQKQWHFEKDNLTRHIAALQAELTSNQNICSHLLKRINLLEVSLLEQKLISTKNKKNKGSNLDNDNENDENEIYQQLLGNIATIRKNQSHQNKIKQQNLQRNIDFNSHNVGFHQEFLTKIITDLAINQPSTLSNKYYPQQSLSNHTTHKHQIIKSFKDNQGASSQLTLHQVIPAHLDAVTSMYLDERRSFLVTVSEDCLIKVWKHRSIVIGYEQPSQNNVKQDLKVNLQAHLQTNNKTNVKNQQSEINLEAEHEPIKVIRQHTGQLFTVTGMINPFRNNTPAEYSQFIFTGGHQGIIKAFIFKSNTLHIQDDHQNIKLQHDTFSPQNSYDIRPLFSIESDHNHKEEDHTIWQLQCHQNSLLSSESDGKIRLYSIFHEDQHHAERQKGEQQYVVYDSMQKYGCRLISTFQDQSYHHTAIKWITDRSFLSACSDLPRVELWDIERRIISQQFNYSIDKFDNLVVASNPQKIEISKKVSKDVQPFQVNALTYSKTYKVVISACEDNCIRIFDYNSGKIIEKLATSSSVSAITMRKDWQMVSGCHDNVVSLWDARKWVQISSVRECHLSKYDAGISCILASGESPEIITSGSDGIVKVFI